MENNKLIIGIENSNGEIIQKQDFFDFKQGRGSIPIKNLYTGQKLFDILYDDLGIIYLEDNEFVIRTILEATDIKNNSLKLLGKIAEAIVVRNCNSNAELNKKFISRARFKSSNLKTARKFKAIGTGLRYTKKNYPTKYNPNDPQRDIIWIDSNENLALIPHSINSATIAGIQIKVSTNWKDYILPDILNSRYEVPIIYFDINNDFEMLAECLHNKNLTIGKDPIVIGKDIIQARAIDYSTHQELMFYVDLVGALLSGKLKPGNLIDMAKRDNIPLLKETILSTTLNNISIDDIIL